MSTTKIWLINGEAWERKSSCLSEEREWEEAGQVRISVNHPNLEGSDLLIPNNPTHHLSEQGTPTTVGTTALERKKVSRPVLLTLLRTNILMESTLTTSIATI